MYSGLQEVAPYWCSITRHLLYKGEISHGTVLNEAMNRNKYLDNCSEKRLGRSIKMLWD
jgi:hypothetical protein